MTITSFFCFRHDVPDNPGDICYGEEMSILRSSSDDYRTQIARIPVNSAFVASPLPRTMQTAFIAAQMLKDTTGLSAVIVPRSNLREQLFGDWVGTKRSALACEPAFHDYKADPVNVPPPGGENLTVFKRRIVEEYNALAGLYAGRNVAVYGHAGGVRALAAEATGLDMRMVLKLSVDPLSLTIITHDSDKKAQGQNPWALRALNLKP